MGSGLVSVGQTFPDFALKDRNGNLRDTAEARSRGPLLVAFFKVNCPTCQLTFPYLQKLSELYPGLAVWGVSQNDASETASFEKQYGTRFPMLIDEGLEITERFDLQTVPAMYLVDASGEVLDYSGSWSRDWINGVAKRVAEMTDSSFVPVVSENDPSPAFKPG